MSEQPSRSAADRQCVIHIGMPRTGTKLLQWHLFSRHREVDYLGLYSGDIAAGHRQFDQCRDATIQIVMREIAFENVEKPDLRRCRELTRVELPRTLSRGRVPVWSWESLATDTWPRRRIRAENLRDVFGGCRVVATIRHPVDLVHSAYFQILNRENVARLSNLGHLPQTSYYTIEDWLGRQFEAGEVHHHLDYARTIGLYCDLFGRDAVRVQMFEQLKHSPTDYVSGLCKFMGIDADEGIRLTAGKRENRRWTTEQYNQLKSAQDSMLRSLMFRIASNQKARRLMGMENLKKSQEGTSARVDISAWWVDRIEEATRAGNRWLAEEWQLPLQQHGYPL